MPTNRTPRINATAAESVLVGEHLENAVRTAPAGRRIGVGVAALGRHLLLSVDRPAGKAAEARSEALYSRVSVPSKDAEIPLSDVIDAIESGLRAFCGVEAVLVRNDKSRGLAVEINRPEPPGPGSCGTSSDRQRDPNGSLRAAQPAYPDRCWDLRRRSSGSRG
jgi:hypothetical protein